MKIRRVFKRMVMAVALLTIGIVLSGAGTFQDAGSGTRGWVVAYVTAATEPEPVLDKWFEGQWKGQTQKEGGLPTSIVLVVNRLKTGDICAVMSFGGTRSCAVQGKYEGESTGKRVFSLTSKGGGSFCDALDYLSVWKTGENGLGYGLISNGRKGEEGTLNREAK